LSRRYAGGRIVIYPQYIDSTRTRSEGRRLNKNDAVPKPTIEEIFEASRSLGLEPFIEDSRYPRDWVSYDKMIIVLKKYPKLKLLKLIALKIKEFRKHRVT